VLHWVFQAAGEAEPPPYADWLSEPEQARLGRLRVVKRRLDWLRGRYAVKEAAARALGERWGRAPEAKQLEVDVEPSGAPFLRLGAGAPALFGFRPGARLPVEVSISHSGGAVLAVASADGAAVGADLERIEPRAHCFVEDFFAEEEIAACAGSRERRDLSVTAVWCAKEAVLKALRVGLTVDARTVVCLPVDDLARDEGFAPRVAGFRCFRVVRMPAPRDPPMQGVWRAQDGFVQAFAVRASRPWGGSA
jgi:4'-phosphopantetheinyl transferase